jgi:hypothetical protein
MTIQNAFVVGFCFILFGFIVGSSLNETNTRLKKLESAITCVQQPQERHCWETVESHFTPQFVRDLIDTNAGDYRCNVCGKMIQPHAGGCFMPRYAAIGTSKETLNELLGQNPYDGVMWCLDCMLKQVHEK